VKILLEECVPLPLRKLLVGHECSSAQEMGWKSIKNGELLSLAEAQFDLFITSDQGLAYQLNLRGRRIAGYNRSSTDPLRLVLFNVNDPDTPYLDPCISGTASEEFREKESAMFTRALDADKI